MKLAGMWSRLYQSVLALSRHRHAERWLAALSFSESSFFPIPPDVMLAPMALAVPQRWWRLALITTLASVAGGIAGWLIGHFLLDAILPWVVKAGYLDAYESSRAWFAEYGVLVVLVAGFTPIPYKVFTIAAGAVAMPLLPFAAASVVGRGGRFFLVAGLMRWLGPRFEPHLARWVDGIGWATIALVAVAVLIWKFPQ